MKKKLMDRIELMKLKGNGKGGFTLIELVVVIAIMAVLALIMVPNLTAYINKADGAKIKANLKSTHTAAQMVKTLDGLDVNDFTFGDEVDNLANQGDSEKYRYTYEDIYSETGSQRLQVSYIDKKGEVWTFDGVEYNEGTPGFPSDDGDYIPPAALTPEEESALEADMMELYTAVKAEFNLGTVHEFYEVEFMESVLTNNPGLNFSVNHADGVFNYTDGTVLIIGNSARDFRLYAVIKGMYVYEVVDGVFSSSGGGGK